MAGIDDLLVQALIAVLAAALFAALTGYVPLRASGVYNIMSTLAFGQMLYFLFVLALGPRRGRRLHPFEPQPPPWPAAPLTGGDSSFYYLCLAARLRLSPYLLLARMVGSRFGRVLNAIRQDSHALGRLAFDPSRSSSPPA